MKHVLLVEPDYRSTYPPLGLMRISTLHKEAGDDVTFVRGTTADVENGPWDRVYVASLFTYELKRTVRTALHYAPGLERQGKLYIGGIGATLVPDYVTSRVSCQLVPGLLDRGNILGHGTPAVEYLPPDYEIISPYTDRYCLTDAYFCRSTIGCVRRCSFCAVPRLEPEFREHPAWIDQIRAMRKRFGERQHLILLDNNVLAGKLLDRTTGRIVDEGFGRGSRLHGRRRRVDFTQAVDIRFVTPRDAAMLGRVNLVPVRFAFDHISLADKLRRATRLFAEQGFRKFNTYMLYNYDDDPGDLYRRMEFNLRLGQDLGIEMTGFPMRFIPTDALRRGYVSARWHWRWLRGLQCILVVTRGLVSPNESFFRKAFGADPCEFKEIISMPDEYIIHRTRYRADGAGVWRGLYGRLSENRKTEFLKALHVVHVATERRKAIGTNPRFRKLFEHYYPGLF